LIIGDLIFDLPITDGYIIIVGGVAQWLACRSQAGRWRTDLRLIYG